MYVWGIKFDYRIYYTRCIARFIWFGVDSCREHRHNELLDGQGY